jgi:hypothetical protein
VPGGIGERGATGAQRALIGGPSLQAAPGERDERQGTPFLGDGLRQKRTALRWPAHDVDLVPLQAISQPAHVRSQQGGPQEQSIKIQP